MDDQQRTDSPTVTGGPTGPAGTPAPAAQAAPAPAPGADRRPVNWTARIVTGLVAVLLLLAGYVVAVAFLPRWWAQRVAAIADGHFTTGIGAGLVIGFVFTALPLLALAATARRHRAWRTRGALVVLAVLLAVPNLITLGIVYGTGDAAHAGERILDVNAPGFRGATLVGAVAAAAFVVALAVLLAGRRRRSRQLADLKAQLADRDARTVLPPDGRSGA